MTESHRPVTVVADSTGDIPDDIAAELGIVVVPLRINFGEQSYRDGVDLTNDQFIDKLVSSTALPTTSQPTVAEFLAAFQTQIDADRDVVCVTISSRLSGTWSAASTAAEQLDASRITVIDSGSLTMELGWIAIAAARSAATGADRAAVAAAAESARDRTSLFAVLKTLDYLYKGGRIGRMGQLVGSALGIKPIIVVREGTLTPLERVRSWGKAVKRVTELVEAEGECSDIIVLYASDREDADAICQHLRSTFPATNVILGRAGAVICTHAGPGAIGVATLRRA